MFEGRGTARAAVARVENARTGAFTCLADFKAFRNIVWGGYERRSTLLNRLISSNIEVVTLNEQDPDRGRLWSGGFVFNWNFDGGNQVNEVEIPCLAFQSLQNNQLSASMGRRLRSSMINMARLIGAIQVQFREWMDGYMTRAKRLLSLDNFAD